MDSLVLTTDDVLAAIHRFDGVRLAKRTLAQWASAGLVVPSIAWRKVRRAPRLYSYADLGRARLVVRLTRQLGMTIHDARDVLSVLDIGHVSLRELLRPVNAREARAMEAVFTVGGGKWRAAMVRIGDSEINISGGGQSSLPLGDAYRIPLADVVKDYRRLARERASGAA